MEEVGKHSSLGISLFFQGDMKTLGVEAPPEKIEGNEIQDSMQQVKLWADRFLKNSCDQGYTYQYVPTLQMHCTGRILTRLIGRTSTSTGLPGASLETKKYTTTLRQRWWYVITV